MTKIPAEDHTSLLKLLDGYWERPLSGLPKKIRAIVEREYVPITWGMTSAKGRKQLAAQIDYQNDPDSADDRKRWFDAFAEMDELRKRIEEWERTEAKSPAKLALKEDRIEVLKAQLAELLALDSPDLGRGATRTDLTHVSEKPDVGSAQRRSEIARKASNARWGQPGGTREKHEKIRAAWASGRYKSRNACAEAECESLGISLSAARRALINSPDP